MMEKQILLEFGNDALVNLGSCQRFAFVQRLSFDNIFYSVYIGLELVSARESAKHMSRSLARIQHVNAKKYCRYFSVGIGCVREMKDSK